MKFYTIKVPRLLAGILRKIMDIVQKQ
ncbi:MAG: stage V sporulation protein SpoVM [Firmicutes bacterium]|nr:stage V sporulation protein SpoVM [Bacillota bacterium]